MSFVFPSLAWAFLLVLAPLLIHLINLMRHRRVQWAPMELLLASYKKQRKWIWLKQMLLLLMRMAAIAAVVAMLAQLIPPDQWAKLFGGRVTHHYIVMDDSYSMSDTAGGQAAFDRAKEVLRRIAERAAAQDTRQRLTLVRFSSAAAGHLQENNADASPADFAAADVDDGAFRDDFEPFIAGLETSQLAVGPESALRVLDEMVERESDDTRIVYVLSDFRVPQWESPADLNAGLARLEEAGAEVHLVDCAAPPRNNLGIVSVEPVEGTRSAGVPLEVNVKVKNHGPARASDVKLTVVTHLYEQASSGVHLEDPSKLQPESRGEINELIDSIEPGDTVTRQVEVFAPAAGKHVVEARLGEDALAIDNQRFCAIDFVEGEPVLIVDGHPQRDNAYFLQSVFEPQVRTADSLEEAKSLLTGIDVTVADRAELREMTPQRLSEFRAVYLLDLPRLDEAVVRRLEDYVREGGGVAFFLGEEINATYYNEHLYRDGEGLFPLALGSMELLPPIEASDDDAGKDGDADARRKLPDFEVVEHPVLKIFGGGDTSFRSQVTIAAFVKAADDWQPPPESNTQVLATLRDVDASPLVVEKPLGDGRVMAFTTTLAPLWNNWGKSTGGGPSFVVTLLSLHAYIAAPQRTDRSQLVGAEVGVELDPRLYLEDLKFVMPGATPLARKVVAEKAKKAAVGGLDGSAEVLSASLAGRSAPSQQGGPTGRMGVYESWVTTTSGEVEVGRWALNIDPGEGNLTRLDADQLKQRLTAPFQHHAADQIQYELADQSSANWSQYILYGLVALLLAEQLLAYSASYHPSPAAAR